MTPQVRLRDVSIQMDVQDGLIAVWAVGTKGDVLYRHGVTEHCPQVHKLALIFSVGKKTAFWPSFFRLGKFNEPTVFARGVASQQDGLD